MALLCLVLPWGASDARPGPAGPSKARLGDVLVLMSAGDRCPERVAAAGLLRIAQRRGRGLVAGARGAGAVARARAAIALRRARDLYLRTNFAGCVALLSIIEQELGRQLADAEERRSQRAHRLLADVNLWLGVCQWSARDPQAAAASFLRSAQLPSSPLPDAGLLPPAVVRAYRRAVRAPRQQVGCKLVAPLSADSLLVDGKGPTLRDGAVQVPAGTHYVVLGGCDAATAACRALQQRIGGSGRRAMRLEARPLGCAIQLPLQQGPLPPTRCVSHREAADPHFVSAVLREVGASLAIVASLRPRAFALRLMAKGRSAFLRQLSGRLRKEVGRAQTVERSAGLLLAVDAPSTPSLAGDGGRDPSGPVWYQRWWVWAAVGAAVVGAATAIALSARTSSVRVVFGR